LHKRALRSKQLAYQGLLIAAQDGKDRMANYHLAKSKHERLIRRAVLERLYFWKEKRRSLREAQREVEVGREKKLIRRTLF